MGNLYTSVILGMCLALHAFMHIFSKVGVGVNKEFWVEVIITMFLVH